MKVLRLLIIYKVNTPLVVAPSGFNHSLKVDAIVESWIFLTLSDALQERLVVADPKIAKDTWDLIEKNFLDTNVQRLLL